VEKRGGGEIKKEEGKLRRENPERSTASDQTPPRSFADRLSVCLSVYPSVAAQRQLQQGKEGTTSLTIIIRL